MNIELQYVLLPICKEIPYEKVFNSDMCTKYKYVPNFMGIKYQLVKFVYN